jgi:hypothetical protein
MKSGGQHAEEVKHFFASSLEEVLHGLEENRQ